MNSLVTNTNKNNGDAVLPKIRTEKEKRLSSLILSRAKSRVKCLQEIVETNVETDQKIESEKKEYIQPQSNQSKHFEQLVKSEQKMVTEQIEKGSVGTNLTNIFQPKAELVKNLSPIETNKTDETEYIGREKELLEKARIEFSKKEEELKEGYLVLCDKEVKHFFTLKEYREWKEQVPHHSQQWRWVKLTTLCRERNYV